LTAATSGDSTGTGCHWADLDEAAFARKANIDEGINQHDNGWKGFTRNHIVHAISLKHVVME
jgi:hypothetical protein